MELRRVVAGYGSNGSTEVQSDGPAPAVVDLPAAVGASLVDIWRSDRVPLSAEGTDDPTLADFVLMPAGSLFRIIDLAPGEHTPLWHLTATVDCNYVAAGEVTLLLGDEDSPTAVVIGTGDTVVVRGVGHAWSNHGIKTCRLVCTSIAAELPAGCEPT